MIKTETAPTMKYLAVRNHLLQEIASGRLASGAKAPTEQLLAQTFKVSRGTVQKALDELVNRGLLSRVQGSGTYVNAPQQRLSRLIGLILPYIVGNSDNIHSRIMTAAEQSFRNHGFNVIVCGGDADYSKNFKQVVSMLEKAPDGIIFSPFEGVGADMENDRIAAEILRQGKALVLVDKDWESPTAALLPCISSANFHAGGMVTDWLIEHGYRKIAFVDTYAASGRQRRKGYIDSLQRHGLPVLDHYMLMTAAPDLTHKGEQEANILAALADPPEAVICVNDWIAVTLMNRLKKKGFRIPEQMGIVGFDDSDFCRVVEPALTSVRQNAEAIGRRAAELVLNLLQGKTVEPGNQTIPCEIVVRESVKI